MSNVNSTEDIYEILLGNEEAYISAAVTGILFRVLPNTTWDNMQAFFGVLVIYVAVYSGVHFIRAKIKRYKESRYVTLPRRERRDAC